MVNENKWFFGTVRWMLRVVLCLIYRVEVCGLEHIPLTGGVIIAPNHQSNLDPPLAGILVPRSDMFFIAKQELFDIPIFGCIMPMIHAFPVRRGNVDRTVLMTAEKLLCEGHVLVMFPEGTRRKAHKIIHAKKGVGMLIQKTHVPVIPTKIINADKWYLFRKIYVIYGKPLALYSVHDQDYGEISETIIKNIEELQV